MFKNYLRVAFRNLFKRKGFAVLNIIGLSIGIACCLLILLYLVKELRYDRFHEKSDRIYRVVQTYRSDSRVDAGASTPFRVGPRLEDEYPHLVKRSTRFFNMQAEKLALAYKKEEKYFKEPNFFFADSTVFDIFTIPLRRGNTETALTKPQSVVITESMARKYFGEEDPMGKELYFEGRMNLTVTGVMADLPATSHITIDFLASFTTLDNFYKSAYDESWYWNPCWTYVLLNGNSDSEDLRQQLPKFADTYYHPNIPQSEQVEMGLQPLTDIHLYSHLDQEIQANGDIKYVYIFSAIALLILLVACINFMNLSTARSASRSREVGVRKVLGANRGSLFYQFMGESFLMTLAAILLALLMVAVLLPFFNNLLDTSLTFGQLGEGWIIAGMAGMLIVVAFLSGTYPALYLSGFNPVRTLRGVSVHAANGKRLRQSLVVAQFGVSIILIIATVFIYRQVNLLQNKDLGFDTSEIVIIPTDLTRTIWYYNDFKQQLLNSSYVESVTGARNVMGSRKNIYSTYQPQGYAEPQSLPSISVMYDFVETYDITVLAGRSFSEAYGTDRKQAVMINQKMVDHLGWGSPEEALGKTFSFDEQEHAVIGVTENFNHTSLHREVEPLVIDMPDTEYGIVSQIEYIAVKISGDRVSEAIDYLRATWDEFDSSHPFDYFFHDERLDNIYKSEKVMGRVSASFTILCIIVACLGLFGLASYSTEIRTREIGIRKALGATVARIVGLLTKEFLLLVLIANVVAWPAAYLLTRWWLQDFAYRIELGTDALWVFFGAGALAIIISLATISYQALSAALVNPADTIRSE